MTMALNDLQWEECINTLSIACNAGAGAAYPWLGRLDKEQADAAAARAMRAAFMRLPVAGRIVAGEGAKDGVEHLAVGEIIGAVGTSAKLDVAVDPIEGTTNLASGLPWALTVAGIAPAGTMFDTGPSLYMDKFVVPKGALRHVDPEADTKSRLTALAAALGKPISLLTIFVLNKPRHEGLVADIVASGARVSFYSAGDVVGTCAVALGSHFDAVMGIGGTPEGMLSACAVKSLGCGFFARLAPQRPDEAAALAERGLSAERWLTIDELIRSDRTAFCAAGISDSPLSAGILRENEELIISSLLISIPTGVSRSQQRHSAGRLT